MRRVIALCGIGGAAVLTAALLYSPAENNMPLVEKKPDSQSPQDIPEEGVQVSSVTIRGARVLVDIADEEDEQRQGLSGRPSLAPNAGMLFVFAEPSQRYFWMKDMHFAIDIIWIDENAKVLGAEERVTPETYPSQFASPEPVAYVLEVNAGWYEQHGISVGDMVTLPVVE